MEGAARRQAEIAQRHEPGQRRDQSPLHVARATTMQPPIPRMRAERTLLPIRLRTGRHDIDMAADQQRTPRAIAAREGGEQAGPAMMARHRPRIGRVLQEPLRLDRHGLGGEAEGLEQPPHMGLHRLLMAGNAGNRHDVAQLALHPGHARGDRGAQSGRGRKIDLAHRAILQARPGRRLPPQRESAGRGRAIPGVAPDAAGF